MSIGISLVLVVFFLAMNAFFVIAEFALVRVRKSQLELAVEEGKPGAKAAMEIALNVNKYLSACQLGITLASLALGWLGEPAFSALIRPLFVLFGLPEAVISVVAVAIGYFIMTTLHVVTGELIPKSFAIFATERYALFTARPLMAFYKITYPIMVLFNGITNAVVRIAGHDPANEHEVYTDDEIKLLIDESTESGLIAPEQNEFVDNIFDIADKDAESLMTPRPDMVCLCMNDTLGENMRIVTEAKFTRFPVYRRDKDDIVGFVSVKDLYNLSPESTMDDVRVRRIVAVPEGMPVVKLLKVLKREKTKMALVVDEHGGTSGLVTMGDIFEEIVGDFDDEYAHGLSDVLTEVAPNHFITTGACPIDDFAERMGFKDENFTEYETLGGLLLDVLDRIPDVGDEANYEEDGTKVRFVVRSMDARRINQVEFWVTEAVPDDQPA